MRYILMGEFYHKRNKSKSSSKSGISLGLRRSLWFFILLGVIRLFVPPPWNQMMDAAMGQEKAARFQSDRIRQTNETGLPHDVQIRRDSGRKTITFLKAKNLSSYLEQKSAFRQLQSENRFSEIALAFLSAQKNLFHLTDPLKEISVQSTHEDTLGFKQVKLQQVFSGIPIWGSQLMIHLDPFNHVYLVQAWYIQTPSGMRVEPSLTTKEALDIVAAQIPGLTPDCPECQSEVAIFVTTDNLPHLVYRVVASLSFIEGWAIMVDAQTGAILDKIPTVQTR